MIFPEFLIPAIRLSDSKAQGDDFLKGQIADLITLRDVITATIVAISVSRFFCGTKQNRNVTQTVEATQRIFSGTESSRTIRFSKSSLVIFVACMEKPCCREKKSDKLYFTGVKTGCSVCVFSECPWWCSPW